MRRLSLVFAVVASVVIAGSAMAANPKLRTFGTGEVATSGNSATIANDAGEYGGVYLASKSQSGKPLWRVTFGFVSTGDVEGGAPRFSWPIDTDRDGATNNGYAFMDVNGCGGNWVSTENPSCVVYFGSESFANWDAFATTHPTYRSAPGRIPFIIADVAGDYAVTEIVLR